MVAHQSMVALASVSSPPGYLAQLNNHIQKKVIPECIGMEILSSQQIFTRN